MGSTIASVLPLCKPASWLMAAIPIHQNSVLLVTWHFIIIISQEPALRKNHHPLKLLYIWVFLRPHLCPGSPYLCFIICKPSCSSYLKWPHFLSPCNNCLAELQVITYGWSCSLCSVLHGPATQLVSCWRIEHHGGILFSAGRRSVGGPNPGAS